MSTERLAGSAPPTPETCSPQGPRPSHLPAPLSPGLVPAFQPHFFLIQPPPGAPCQGQGHAQHVPQATQSNLELLTPAHEEVTVTLPTITHTRHRPALGSTSPRLGAPWQAWERSRWTDPFVPGTKTILKGSEQSLGAMASGEHGQGSPAAPTSNSLLDGSLPEGQDNPGPLPKES